MSNRTRHVKRLWIGILVIVGLIAATAVAGLAATKNFTFSVSPTTVAAGTNGQVFNVAVTNVTPSATINSFSVQVPSQFNVQSAALSTASGANSNPNLSAVVSTSGQEVDVQYLDPVKNHQKATVSITTNVTSTGLSCGTNSSGTWSVTAYTGSNLGGNTFADTSTGTDLTSHTTNITETCSLSFTGQPSDAVKNTNVSPAVKVTLLPAASGKTVTLTIFSGPTGAKISGDGGTTFGSQATATTDGSGVATFSSLQLDTAGAYTLQAAATNYGTATSNSFRVFASSFGGSNCTGSASGGGTSVDITAGTGGTCDSVPYTLTATSDEVDFFKDATATSKFKITISWGVPAGDYPSKGTTTINVNGTVLTPDWCAIDNGAAQYPVSTGWCVASSTVEPHTFPGDPDPIQGMQVTETLYGSGDPVFSHT